MQIRLDGMLLGAKLVASTSWKTYSFVAPVAAGSHVVSIRYVNELRSSACDRNLRIDHVILLSNEPINTGTAGSRCEPSDGGLAPSPAPPDVSTSRLGPGPAYYEYADPTMKGTETSPKGTVLLIHGGGWFTVGSGAVAAVRPEADRWRARGWATLALTYRGCASSLDDVLWFYEAARGLDVSRPLCAAGGSAGGHLALMLAALRPIACVVSRAGPTDLTLLATQAAYDATTGGTQRVGPQYVANLALAAFGESMLADMSPVMRAPSISTPALLATAAADPLIPQQQAWALGGWVQVAQPEASIEFLSPAPGPVPFVHAGIDQAGWEAYLEAENAIAAAAAA